MLFPKPMEDMSNEELAAWVAQQVRSQRPEDLLLDYKQAIPQASENANIAKDLCAFANTAGGVIIYGVREDPQRQGVPAEIVGVTDAPDFEARLASIGADSLMPPLLSTRVRVVKIEAANALVSVALAQQPESLEAPHMIIGAKDFRYYARSASTNQPVPMTEREVRDLYERKLRLKDAAADFLKTADYGEANLVVAEGKERYLLRLGLCPLLCREGLFQPEHSREWLQQHHTFPSQPSEWHPFLGGVEEQGGNLFISRVWRNGAATFLIALEGIPYPDWADGTEPHLGPIPSLSLLKVSRFAGAFAAFASAFHSMYLPRSPCLFALGVDDIEGAGLLVTEYFRALKRVAPPATDSDQFRVALGTFRRWRAPGRLERTAVLAGQQVVSENGGALVNQCADWLCQAFGMWPPSVSPPAGDSGGGA